jgi:TRAP-type mannitol/chloroaromatic compound transport system permease small subunit
VQANSLPNGDFVVGRLKSPDQPGRTTGSDHLQAGLRLSGVIDGISRWLGIVANWMVLIATLVCALDALLRYSVNGILIAAGSNSWAQALFEIYRDNSNTLRDLQLMFFAGMVMLGAPWTFKVNEHVRVDLLYTMGSDRKRVWIDLIGALVFLLPFCVIMIYFSWPWFLSSYLSGEGSTNAGGMPRWPLKLFVPLGFGLLLLQGVSEIIKCIAALTSDYRREHAYEKPMQ